ncbi:MAG: hypothetical protein RR311_01930 [Comamonas sp.]
MAFFLALSIHMDGIWSYFPCIQGLLAFFFQHRIEQVAGTQPIDTSQRAPTT